MAEHENAGETAPELIEFPCDFPIKVMGRQVDGFTAAMVAVVRQFDPSFDATTVESRPSRAGNYLGLTLSVRVHDRAQLDEVYRCLSTHSMVKIVL